MLNNKPINVLVTYIKQPNINGFRALVEQAIQHLQSDQIGLTECHISDVMEVAQDLMEKGCKILLCTGATANYLQKKIPLEIQVIRTGAFDVIQAISNLRQYKKIALIGNRATVNLQDYSDVFALNIEQFIYDSYLDAKNTVELVKQKQFDAVIGSPVAIELASLVGLKGQLAISIESLKEQMQFSLHALDRIIKDQIQVQQLNHIFDYLNDGICFISRQGFITFVNRAMSKLLTLNEGEVLNQRVENIFPHLKLELYNEENTHQILKIHNTEIAIHLCTLHNENLNGFILSAQELNTLERSNSEFRKVTSQKFTTRYNFSNLLTQDKSFKENIELAKQYALTDTTILITGESGTGKEVLAQSIHKHSYRHKEPFVAINCASFPESILESELFGYEDGAFTGAKKNGKIGLIEAAHNGTLFLDEIGDMPLHLQTRFLRVLQERQIQRLGAIYSHSINIRVIAATHCNLEDLVKQGKFRADLYYRLNILRLFVPALRQRRIDILLLAQHFLSRQNIQLKALPEPLVKALGKHNWLGNVRELENIIERIMILIKLDKSIDSMKLMELNLPELFVFNHSNETVESKPLKAFQVDQESKLIERALLEANGNLDLAAQILNISRTTLWRKMKTIKTVK